MATSAPADASPIAIARPMPRELPVTNAFLPRRLKLGTISSGSFSVETSDSCGVRIADSIATSS